MSAAGRQFLGNQIPNERIATAIETTDSATFTTTETEVMSVTAPLVEGRIYRVRFAGNWLSTVDGDRAASRIREGDTAGATLTSCRTPHLDGGSGVHFQQEVEFTAASTGNQEFIVSGERISGSGDLNLDATAERPAYLYVDYIRDA